MRVWEQNYKGRQEDWQSKTKGINEGTPKKRALVGNKIPEHAKLVGGMLLTWFYNSSGNVWWTKMIRCKIHAANKGEGSV